MAPRSPGPVDGVGVGTVNYMTTTVPISPGLFPGLSNNERRQSVSGVLDTTYADVSGRITISWTVVDNSGRGRRGIGSRFLHGCRMVQEQLTAVGDGLTAVRPTFRFRVRVWVRGVPSGVWTWTSSRFRSMTLPWWGDAAGT